MIPRKKLEMKAASRPSTSNPLAGFFDFLGSQGFFELQSFLAIRYYLAAAPVASAVDKIAEPFAEIMPRVYDTKAKEFVDHEVIELLKKPNPEDSLESFQIKLAAWYLINGEVFVNATGIVDRPPLELFVFPSSVTSLAEDQEGFLGSIQFGRLNNQEVYKQAARNLGGRFRYYSQNELGEAWQIKNFNPKNSLRGGSKLQSVMPEIEQYIESSTHNLSMLKRGARPSGVFSSKEVLPDDQFERLKEQIDNWYSGSANAGRPILIDGGDGVQYTEALVNNRDMDFFQLKVNVTEMVYSRMDVPLALISTKSMTLDNLKVAKISLYDDAVIPLANRVFGELTQMLLPRYKNSENLIITYDDASIPALEGRRMENAKARKDVGVNTVNELRSIIGDQAIENGDELVKPAPSAPAQQTDQRNYEQMLRDQKTADGSPVYSEDEVKAFAKAYF